MKIRIEIDVKPEELRRFLGLPDVAGIQDELLHFIRDRIASDPAGFVKDNIEVLRKSRAVRRLLYGVDAGDDEEDRPAGRSRRASKADSENDDD